MNKKFQKIIFISLGMIFLLVGCSLTETNKEIEDNGKIYYFGEDAIKEQMKDSLNSSISIESNEISEEELWSLLNNLPIYVEKIDVSPAFLKEDCFFSAIFWNNSGIDIRDVKIVYLAWDTNGLPLLLGSNYEGKTYNVSCNYDGINMLSNTSYGEGKGITISDISPETVGTVSAVMYSFTDFDGYTYYNPYFDAWLSLYDGKKLQ